MLSTNGNPSRLLLIPVLFCSMLLFQGCKGRERAGSPESTAAGKFSTARLLACSRSATPVTVDGLLEEYASAECLVLDDTSGIPDPNQVKIFTLWDENYLYIAYRVADRYLVGFQTERDHKALYKDDMIEVLLDPRKDATDLWLEDDIVYHINICGQVKDDRGTPEGKSDATWQSQARFAVVYDGTLNDSTDLDRGYSVELAVPWPEIGQSPQPGLTLGIDFASGDAEGPDEHLWDWCGARPFRQPSAYGLLGLK